VCLIVWLVTGAVAAPATASSVIVKLRAEGPHAITACAETLTRSGEPFASASAARSDSLDQVTKDLGVRGMRAVFRRPDGKSFREQSRAMQNRLRERTGATGADTSPDLAHVYRVALAPGVDPRAAAARFRADAHVVWAQPNYTVEVDRLLDDPFLNSAGSWGQNYADQWGHFAIEVPEAWDTTLGEGVVVGVVDTGVDPTHPDFAGNLWVNPGEDLDGDGIAEPDDENGIDDDDNGFVDDLRGWDFQGEGVAGDDGFPVGDADPTDGSGHGSHVAGTIAARGSTPGASATR
jgi:subtilisin family serine protease